VKQIAAVGAVENVRKAERFVRSFLQAPCVKSAFFADFHRYGIFHSASRPAFFDVLC
jgi:hypothetical protein